jgi:hypothetical protein
VPAPTKAELQTSLRAAFIAAGPEKFAKRDANGNVVPGELQDALNDIIEAIATGLAAQWAIWQATQTVVGTATGVTSGPASAPVTGVLP